MYMISLSNKYTIIKFLTSSYSLLLQIAYFLCVCKLAAFTMTQKT